MQNNTLTSAWVEAQLASDVKLPHQASSIAYAIFTLIRDGANAPDAQTNALKHAFLTRLPVWGGGQCGCSAGRICLKAG